MNLLMPFTIKKGLIMENYSLDPDKCLEEAEAFHGHLCAGIMLGTRMAVLGLRAIGIRDPKGEDKKNFMVFVEMDRCATDAIMIVTGCRPGKRTMKVLDYGKMAAAFVNLKTGKAVRVAAKNTDGDKVYTREMIQQNPHTLDYAKRTDEELFSISEVKVELKQEDLPGPPLRTVPCFICGERVMDMKDVMRDGQAMCRPCAEGNGYYRVVN
jgi:formylmethanofuran dehydrogenase subunit E